MAERVSTPFGYTGSQRADEVSDAEEWQRITEDSRRVHDRTCERLRQAGYTVGEPEFVDVPASLYSVWRRAEWRSEVKEGSEA